MYNKLKILVLSRGYPSKKYPMYGIFEFDQAKALKKLGHDVIFGVVDTRSIRRFRKFGYESFVIDDIPVMAINFPMGRIPRMQQAKVNSFVGKRLYKKIIKKFGVPDVIHAHFTHIANVATEIKKDYNVPVVITEHFSKYMETPIENWLIKTGNLTYPHVDSAIVVSPSLKEMIDKIYNIKSIYIPNIVEVESFDYVSKTNHDEVQFISVGLLIKRKRMDLIIESFYDAFKGNPKYKLVIIGSGPEKKYLESLIEKYKLIDSVKLTGSLTRKEIGIYMNQSDYFVLPSQAETFGVVYIEAMASGLPVIGTRCGGPEHIINETNGILIDIDDKNALTQSLLKIQNNYYDKEKISSHTKDLYASENIARLITEVLKRSIR